jgi:methionine sulfoxide reductase heme-binding subunit
MRGTNFALQGWGIVGFSALTVGTIVGVIWLFHGIDEQGMRMAIRATARTSTILFLSAFVASSLRKLWSTPLSAWLLHNRRYLGISMAVSHTYHAIAIFGLWFVTAGTAPHLGPLGTFGYVLLIAMTVTSFERPADWLGKRSWKILHTTGMHFFWLGFLFEYSFKLPKSMLIYSPFVLLLVLAMMLRLVASRKQKQLVTSKSL